MLCIAPNRERHCDDTSQGEVSQPSRSTWFTLSFWYLVQVHTATGELNYKLFQYSRTASWKCHGYPVFNQTKNKHANCMSATNETTVCETQEMSFPSVMWINSTVIFPVFLWYELIPQSPTCNHWLHVVTFHPHRVVDFPLHLQPHDSNSSWIYNYT